MYQESRLDLSEKCFCDCCGWRGTLEEAKREPNSLIECPECDIHPFRTSHPVELESTGDQVAMRMAIRFEYELPPAKVYKAWNE